MLTNMLTKRTACPCGGRFRYRRRLRVIQRRRLGIPQFQPLNFRKPAADLSRRFVDQINVAVSLINVLGEVVHAYHAAGAVLAVIGIYLTTTARRPAPG